MADKFVDIKGEKQIDKIIRILEFDVGEYLDDVVIELTEQFDEIVKEKMRDRVYTLTTRKKTGTALGSFFNEKPGQAQARVFHDTRLKWLHTDARLPISYGPMLNLNRRVPILNTLFWDDSVEEVVELSIPTMQNHLINTLKKRRG